MSIALAVAITVSVATAAMLLILLIRRLAPEEGLFGDPESNHSASALAIVGTAFAVLVSFVMLLVLQGYGNAQRTADDEARVAGELYILSELGLPDIRENTQGALLCYARAVIADEWPRMDEGERSPLVDRWALDLVATIQTAEVRTDKQSTDYDQLVSEQDELEDARFGRLQEADALIPSLLWVALIAGGVVVILGLCIFGARTHKLSAQLAMAFGVAVVVSLNLLVIPFLDAPFRGSGAAIEPETMGESLSLMEQGHAGLHAKEPIPCDEDGTPNLAAPEPVLG